MKKFAGLIIITALVLSFQSCYYDKEDIVYPKSDCDTTDVTYTKDIQNIITARCSGCHVGAVVTNINLGTYEALKARADNGRLINRITTADLSRLMPRGGPRLPECEINKIKAWVNRNSPN